MAILLLLLVFPASLALAVAVRSHFGAKPPDPYRCGVCGYAREGLPPERLCPECGHDPMRPPPQHDRLPRWVYLLFIPQALMVPVAVAWVWPSAAALALVLWPLSAAVPGAWIALVNGRSPRPVAWFLFAATIVPGLFVGLTSISTLVGIHAGRVAPSEYGLGFNVQIATHVGAVGAGFAACAGFVLGALGVLVWSSVRRDRTK